MSLQTQYRMANPRLGLYFSIFASIVVSLIFFLLIVEELGGESRTVRLMMVGVPIALFALIAVLTFTLDSKDFFVVGRRVPAFFNGLAVAVTTLGSVGVLFLTGTLFHQGADGLALVIGFMSGVILLGILLASFFRKFGAYSVPGYLAGRFDNRLIGLLSAIFMIVPCGLFLIAEIKVGAKLLGIIVERSPEIALAGFVMCMVFMIIWGGARSLVWSNGGQGIVALLALLVLPVIAALLLTNLPLPQITYGTLLDDIARYEAEYGVGAGASATQGASAFLADTSKSISHAYLEFGGSITGFEFLALVFTIMVGVSAAPHILVRASASAGVGENRKAMGWAAFLIGIVLLTLPAIAVFVRFSVFENWIGLPPDQLPQIVEMFRQAGMISVDEQVERLAVGDLKFSRDSSLLMFPAALGFPEIFTYVLFSGVIALALGAASAQTMALSTMLTLDVAYGDSRKDQHSNLQMIIMRVVMIIVGGLAGWLALNWSVSPVDLMLVGLQISAGAGFPVLVLSIWWKRINIWGALAAVLAGALVTIFYIIMVGSGMMPPIAGITHHIAAFIGVPVGLLAGGVFAVMTPKPGTAQTEIVRDIRVPGGEALYDRALRYARLKAQREKIR